MTMRTILQILLTASVIVHFSGVIAFGVVELKRRLRRLAGRDEPDEDDLVIEPEDELAAFRRRRTSASPQGLSLLTALNQTRGADFRR
jgi:hypothetical protein